MKLSHMMRHELRIIAARGDEGKVDYNGRTYEALERRGLVDSDRAGLDDWERRVGKWRWFITDAGKEALK